MELIATLVVLLLVLAAYWSLVILPRQQEFKKHQYFVRRLKPGDRVITYGGLIATIVDLQPDLGEAKIRLADGIEVRIITAALTQPYDPATLAHNARIGIKEGSISAEDQSSR